MCNVNREKCWFVYVYDSYSKTRALNSVTSLSHCHSNRIETFDWMEARLCRLKVEHGATFFRSFTTFKKVVHDGFSDDFRVHTMRLIVHNRSCTTKSSRVDGPLVCLSIVVAYKSSKCPFTKFSNLGHCDLIMAQYCHFKYIMKMCNFTPFLC